MISMQSPIKSVYRKTLLIPHWGKYPCYSSRKDRKTMCSLKWWSKKQHTIGTKSPYSVHRGEADHICQYSFSCSGCVSTHSRVRTFTKCTKEERGTQNHSQNGMNSFTGWPSAWRCHKAICSADNEEKIHTIHVTGYMRVRKSKGEALLEVNHCLPRLRWWEKTIAGRFSAVGRAGARSLRSGEGEMRKSLWRSEAHRQPHEYMFQPRQIVCGHDVPFRGHIVSVPGQSWGTPTIQFGCLSGKRSLHILHHLLVCKRF